MKFKPDWQLTLFWILAFAIAWSIALRFGVDEEFIRANYAHIASILIIYVPKFAFTISGLILLWMTSGLKELWTRLTHVRVKWTWYALAYLGPAFLYLTSALTTSLLSTNQPLSPLILFPDLLWQLTLGAQTGILTYFLFRGGLGEEIGLRGFALTRLQSRHSLLKASLTLGFWWGLWHLPAWMENSIIEIIIMWLAILSLSIIFTWFYSNTFSLPIVMLLHAAINSFDDIYETIFPGLLNQEWELPYLAGILLIGSILGVILTIQANARTVRRESA